jgi:uncharacterized protein
VRSGAFEGVVFHRRLRPKPHDLRYRVFSLLIDLDELPRLGRELRWFGHNSWNLFSLLERDHGAGTATGLKSWVLAQAAAAGVDPQGLTIDLLCYPRILGYVFNPLSVYFCRRADGAVAAMLYEVNNTFGGRHAYVLAGRGERDVLHQSCTKALHVSPFNRVEGHYDFTVHPPADTVSLGIRYSDDAGPLLNTGFAGRRTTLSDRVILGLFARYPLMTLKVIAGIHWEALRLLLKGVRLGRPRPHTETTPESHVA